MISYEKVQQQLKDLRINVNGWGRTEYGELCNILAPNEAIEECVNGYYEAGFALLVATKNRLLIVDKKPLNYLTVEDMRFDMINEFDYQHRLFGAQIKVSAGFKTLHFTSLNQVRLRRVLGYVQTRMTQIKEEQQTQQEAQERHLDQMNKQLEMYLQLQQLQQQQYFQQAQRQPLPYGNEWQQQPSYTSQQMSMPQPNPNPNVNNDQPHIITPQQLGIAAMKRVIPVISAYTRLPLLSQRHRFQAQPGSVR